MVRNIDDVKAELRKITDSKPVHAAAGAGVLASRTLLELPWRLVQWTRDNPPESLPGRANEYVQTARTNMNGYVQAARTNANEYVQTARTDGYAQTARTNMNGYVQQARTNANGYVQTARTRAADNYDKLAEHGKKAINGQPDSTQRKSTTQSKNAAQSKGELNGKPRGKAPSSRTGTSD
jgi:vacuolar-type H+-ATPase subunit H